jgi:prepilin signal peptidase PulO-like enzyme (type II secretory pathway)
MPRNLPTYSICAPAGEARSHKQLGGIAGTVATGWFEHKALTVVAILAVLIALVLLSNPLGWAALGIVIIAGLQEVKDWYYNGRILCIRDRDCAVGTVIAAPEVSFDGDRKLNLALAPYSQGQVVETLLDHLSANEAMLIDNTNFNDPPFHASAPVLPVAAQRRNDFGILRGYLKALQSSDPADGDAESRMFRQVLIGIANRLMTDPARNFYNRYYRKDPAFIAPGTALDGAIPLDFDPAVNWDGPNAQSPLTAENQYLGTTDSLNPMFRFDTTHMVFYLHCEIEGYYIKLLIDNLILAFSAWLALMIALSFLGPLAPLAAIAIAALIYFLKWLIDQITGNDGDADEPDVDVDDPDVVDDAVLAAAGDVVVTYGNWIMDTEHHNYFEIHPVRAYYLVARNSLGREPVLVDGNMDQEEFGHENFDVRDIDATRANEICQIITRGEEGSNDDVILRSGAAGLSYGLTTKFGGGQTRLT